MDENISKKEMKIEYSYNKMCRTCLSVSSELTSLNDKIISIDNIQTPMLYILSICTSIEVQNDEICPYLMCNSCEEKLCNAYIFRHQAIRAEDTVRNYINLCDFNKVENESNDKYFHIDNENDEQYVNEAIKLECFIDDDDDDVNNFVENTNDNILNEDSKCNANSDRITVDDVEIQNALDEHKKKFNTRHECRLCGFIASNLRGFSVHVNHRHKEMKNKWCSKCLIEVDNLKEHKKTHTNDKVNWCKFCNKTFRNLAQHLPYHSGDRFYKCNECNDSYTSKRLLLKHKYLHSNGKCYQCDECDKSFLYQSTLLIHRLSHTKQTVYKCQFCNVSFYKLKYLTRHFIKTSHNELIDRDLLTNVNTNIKDEITNDKNLDDDFISSNQDNIKEEKQESKLMIGYEIESDWEDMVIDKNSRECAACGKTFSSNLNLRNHMSVHTGKAPFSCQYCSKLFTSNYDLDAHVRTHTGEKPHVCHICGKGFAQSSVLNTHMKLHTGKTEQCTICEKRFCRPSLLRVHMRKHAGVRPYLCTECGQRFYQSSHLREHVKTHSEDRPFQCEHCNRTFKHKQTLTKHRLIHTGEKPYKCDVCTYACIKRYRLMQHMRLHNKKKVNDEQEQIIVRKIEEPNDNM